MSKQKFSLSTQCEAKLEQLANETGISKTSIIEQLVLGFELKPKPEEAFLNLLRDLFFILDSQPPDLQDKVADILLKIEERYIWSTNGNNETLAGNK